MKLKRPKVSILMPSLNSGEFIRECMESVVHQTLEDIEIICIDAGSTDGTLEILREYERNDPRIRVIVSDKKSMGYQYNLGLDAAAGDYIGMVETDDWIEADTFESLWMAASRQDVDIVAANQFLYYTKPEIHDQPLETLKKCPYEQIFLADLLSRYFRAFIFSLGAKDHSAKIGNDPERRTAAVSEIASLDIFIAAEITIRIRLLTYLVRIFIYKFTFIKY